jgi:glucose-1-phosphate thymidylyltransferase
MKGVILAGGNGTRLMPLTSVTNKSLLPVYDRPMIFHPLQMMVESGIEEILIVTSGKTAGEMVRVLGDGSQFGLKRLYFTLQEQAGGIAQALSLAEQFAGGEKVFVILGDNLLFGSQIAEEVRRFAIRENGAKVFLKAVPDPERFGIADIDGAQIVSIEEKPKRPKSNMAITGLYLYDATVFDRIRELKPSARGELEVTDLNKLYLKDGALGYEMLHGDWIDAGTFDSMLDASLMAREAAQKAARKSYSRLEVAA